MAFLKKWLPALIIMGFIFYLSALPGTAVDSMGLGKESYHINGHFLMFFLLCLSFFRATGSSFSSVVLSILYGVSDEFHQVFTPGRSAGPFDVLVDSLGALLAGLFLWKLYPNLYSKLKLLRKK